MAIKRNAKGHFLPGESPNPLGASIQKRPLVELARQHTAEAIETLTQIMLDAKSDDRARVAAAQAILDRGYGKPAQAIRLSGEIDIGAEMRADRDKLFGQWLRNPATAAAVQTLAHAERPD